MRTIVPGLAALLLVAACTIDHRDGAADAAISPAADASAVSTSDAAVAANPDAGGAGLDAAVLPGPDAGAASTGFFPAGSIWYQDVSGAVLDPSSSMVIADLEANGGWGNQGVFQIDFSIEVLEDDGSAPMRAFQTTGDFYSPDCDEAPMPVPAGGALEGEDGYECTADGDCHLLVVQPAAGKLYEMWRANIVGGVFYGGCLAIWDLSRVYPDNLRGEGCTSADAAGFPIAPLLFSADEVASGEIKHAIRYVLPNARIQHYVYVHPATHSTGPTAGGSSAPPYGAHLRLRADYDLASLPSEGARVVARALQKYGMFLADGGQIALTARSDRFTAAKWSGLLEAQDLAALEVTDFEMVDHGAWQTWSGDCVRNP